MVHTALLSALVLAAVSPLTLAHGQDAAISAASEAAEAFGPAVGEAAPGFTLVDSAGAERTLANLSGSEGVLIYFNRSLDWCPICLRQTLEANAIVDQFEAAGWNVAVLTYDSADTLATVKERRELDLILLSDPESAVIDAYGVRDPIYADPDHMAHGVPYPIAFAIASDGEIVGKYWHEAGLGERRGYATRVTAEDVLADLN